VAALAERVAPAFALRESRKLRKADTPDRPGKSGMTAAQESAINSLLRGNPLHPHDLISGPTVQQDGSVTCEVRSIKDGRHMVNVSPSGTVTRIKPTSDPDSDDADTGV
jgi:hypothetical protein